MPCAMRRMNPYSASRRKRTIASTPMRRRACSRCGAPAVNCFTARRRSISRNTRRLRAKGGTTSRCMTSTARTIVTLASSTAGIPLRRMALPMPRRGFSSSTASTLRITSSACCPLRSATMRPRKRSRRRRSSRAITPCAASVPRISSTFTIQAAARSTAASPPTRQTPRKRCRLRRGRCFSTTVRLSRRIFPPATAAIRRRPTTSGRMRTIPAPMS